LDDEFDRFLESSDDEEDIEEVKSEDKVIEE
jgi:hypothetical protein